MGYSVMEPVNLLKSRLSEDNTLYVQDEDGYCGEAGFEWNDPVSDRDIQKFESKNKIVLPASYKQFLKISNGAVLFREMEYGQWGCRILGLSEIMEETNNMEDYGCFWPDSWIVFANWLGDGDVLAFDLEMYNSGERHYILYGEGNMQTNEFELVKGDFAEWLDRFITAQGAKYWTWFGTHLLVKWNRKNRLDYIREWYNRGYGELEGGWHQYHIHHIKPRLFGGDNSFDNLVPLQREVQLREFNRFWRNYSRE